jgi:protein involved in polysaccharide export with SLBB domain
MYGRMPVWGVTVVGARRALIRGGLSLLLGVLLAPALCPAPAAAEEVRPPESYRLQPGDEVALNVMPRAEYSSQGIIAPDGLFRLKNGAAVKATGMTLSELEEAARKELEKVLRRPQVSAVLVRLARPLPQPQVAVVGAVQRPGPMDLDLEAGLRVLKAIELAGGATPDGDLSRVTITGKDLSRVVVDLSTPERAQDLNRNRLLKDGDSVEVPLVPKAAFISIGGEVLKPGAYELQPGQTLEDLIVAAGKLTLVADLEHIEIQRKERRAEIINLLERARLGAEGRVVLQPGDSVFVPKHANVVILVGAIPNPGPRAIQPGQTLREFLMKGSVETLAALDENKVHVKGAQLIRSGQQGQKINLRAVLTGRDRKNDVVLQNGDVLFLPGRAEPERTAADYLRSLPYVGTLVNLFAP